VTFTLIWGVSATTAMRRLREEHPDQARAIAVAVRALADDPYPGSSHRLGDTDFRRLLSGRCRVIYLVADSDKSVMVTSVGIIRG
jgi:mRNA-degrading endonuclease RelE of RelBE toxin-antitoxin system